MNMAIGIKMQLAYFHFSIKPKKMVRKRSKPNQLPAPKNRTLKTSSISDIF